ncbi:MAG TPA: glycosyltransferase, partial [Crinalium sp.]
MSLFNTSVIIPAHNAAETLSKTLESLSKQTIPNWEAIVVDDGSMDDTAAIATQFATQDKRIRVISQPQSGVSAARNQGIELAQFDWLLFLDADDWIAPHHLERMAEKLTANPELDGVYCGWVRITPDGHTLQESYCPKAEALFPTLTRTCAFAIHACIVRKSLVQTAGGFDPCLRTCEDWDLWQRLARSGAQFGSIREAMAYYRMRPNSVSINGSKLLADAIKVINRGHQPDPRVTHPHSTYANGQPNEQRSEAILQWSCWAAGLMIGADQDACELMSLIGQLSAPSLDPSQVAYSIFYAAVLPTCQSLSGWSKLWPQSESKVQAFLSALEIQSQTIGLAQRSQRSLERLVLSHWKPSTPVMVGATYALRIEVSEPFADIHPPETAERLYAMIELKGDFLGTIELPVCDGIVLASVLADAIAAHYSWPILGRFFVNTVYPQWCQPGQETEIESWHDSIGWITLLRELWNRPDFTEAQFYDPTFAEYSDTPPQPISAPDDHLTVEVSSDLPTVNVETAALNVLATVGGAVLGIISVPAVNRIVTAQAIRAAIITAGGLELCRLCVREALLGRSFHDPMPIRERLAIATQAKLNSLNSTASSVTPSDTTTVFGRRSGPIGSSISRQAAFPVAAQDAIVTMAEIAGEPSQLASSTTPSRLIYQPDWVHAAAPTQSLKNVSLTQSSDTHRPGRDHFETLFAVSPDPWKYTSPYEQTKYEQTLSLLPGGRIRNALEIACAEGHFTVQLAPHVDRLLVADISQIALDRTAERCSNFNHIQFQQLDLVKDT